MGSSASKTHVANATGRPILVYYDVDRLKLKEITVNSGVEPSVSAKAGLGVTPVSVTAGVKTSGNSKMVFKQDCHSGFIRIPANDYSKIVVEGTIYASVFVEGTKKNKRDRLIVEDYLVPKDKSLIVTKNVNIKFSNAKEDIWVDEFGFDHMP